MERPPKIKTDRIFKEAQEALNKPPEKYIPTVEETLSEGEQSEESTLSLEEELSKISSIKTRSELKDSAGVPFEAVNSIHNSLSTDFENINIAGNKTIHETILATGISEDKENLDADKTVEDERREGYEKNIEQRVDILSQDIEEREQGEVDRRVEEVNEKYDELATARQGNYKAHIEGVAENNVQNKKEAPELYKENVKDAGDFYKGVAGKKYTKSKEGFYFQNHSPQEKDEALSVLINARGFALPTEEILQDSYKRAAISKERIEKIDAWWDGKKGFWQKADALPTYLARRSSNGFRHARDRIRAREHYYVDELEKNQNIPNFIKRPMQGVVKSTGFLLRDTPIILGIGAIFGLSWVTNLVLDKITKWRKKRYGELWFDKKKGDKKK